jgi:ribosomal protein L18E
MPSIISRYLPFLTRIVQRCRNDGVFAGGVVASDVVACVVIFKPKYIVALHFSKKVTRRISGANPNEKYFEIQLSTSAV